MGLLTSAIPAVAGDLEFGKVDSKSFREGFVRNSFLFWVASASQSLLDLNA